MVPIGVVVRATTLEIFLDLVDNHVSEATCVVPAVTPLNNFLYIVLEIEFHLLRPYLELVWQKYERPYETANGHDDGEIETEHTGGLLACSTATEEADNECQQTYADDENEEG